MPAAHATQQLFLFLFLIPGFRIYEFFVVVLIALPLHVAEKLLMSKAVTYMSYGDWDVQHTIETGTRT